MRFLLFSLLFLVSFSGAILEFQNCPSVANSNFTLNVISNSEPQVAFNVLTEGLTITSLEQSDQVYSYYVNFTQVQRGFYKLTVSAEGTAIECGFAYASPEIITTKIPDSNLFVIVAVMLVAGFALFRKSKK